MATVEDKKTKKNLAEPKVEEAGGMRGWLLKKARTFVLTFPYKDGTKTASIVCLV